MPSKATVHRPLVGSSGTMLLLLLALNAILSGVQGSLQYMETSSQRKAHYCGANLSDTLAKLCNRFNGLRKKSDNILMPYQKSQLLLVEDYVEELQSLNDRSSNLVHQALTTLQHLDSRPHIFRRVRRQVVAECCYQSCTIDTLKSYCAE